MNDAEQVAGLAATPGYRYAEVVGNQLFVAGQVPHDRSGTLLGHDDPGRQAQACLDNLATLVARSCEASATSARPDTRWYVTSSVRTTSTPRRRADKASPVVGQQSSRQRSLPLVAKPQRSARPSSAMQNGASRRASIGAGPSAFWAAAGEQICYVARNRTGEAVCRPHRGLYAGPRESSMLTGPLCTATRGVVSERWEQQEREAVCQPAFDARGRPAAPAGEIRVGIRVGER